MLGLLNGYYVFKFYGCWYSNSCAFFQYSTLLCPGCECALGTLLLILNVGPQQHEHPQHLSSCLDSFHSFFVLGCLVCWLAVLLAAFVITFCGFVSLLACLVF